MKIRLLKKPTNWLLILILGAPFIFFILNASLIAAILLILCISLLLPVTKMGLITRIILTLLIVVSLDCAIGLVTWQVKEPFTTGTWVTIYTSLGVVCWLLFRNRAQFSGIRQIFPWQDLVALSALVLCLGLLLFPLTSRNDTTTLVRTELFGIDNVSHISLIRSIEASHGYLYGRKDAAQNEVTTRLSDYPQGMHLNAAIADQIIKPTDKPRSVRMSLLLYILFSAFFYSIMTYLFVYLALELTKYIRKRRRSILAITALIFGLGIFANSLLGLYSFGFIPQIASFAIIFGEILILLKYLRSNNQTEKIFYGITAGVLCVGTAFVYLFSWPVALLGLILFFGKKDVRTNLPWRRWHLSALIILTALSCVQMVLYLFYFRNTKQLGEEGGTLIFNNEAIWGLFLASWIYLANKRIKTLEPIRIFVVAAGLFSATIFTVQMLGSGQAHYYFYKSTYLIIMLFALSMVYLTVDTMDAQSLKKMRKYISAQTMILSGVVLLLMMWSYASYTTPTLRSYISRAPYSLSDALGSSMLGLSEKPGVNSTTIVSIGNNCISSDDSRYMRFIMAMSGKATPTQRSIEEKVFDLSLRPTVYKMIIKYQMQQPDKKLIIVTADSKIKGDLIKLSGHNSQYLEFINPYQDRKIPATGCRNIDKPTITFSQDYQI